MSELNKLLSAKSIFDTYSEDDIERAIAVLNTPIHTQMIRSYLEMKNAKRDYLQLDALDGKYKRKDSEDYENMRLAAVSKLESMENMTEKVEFLMRTAKEIAEGIQYISYNEAFGDCYQVKVMIEMCRNMAASGKFSLTDICSAVPNTIPGDVYKLCTKYLGLEMELSKEEQRQVKEYEKQESEEKQYTAREIFSMLSEVTPSEYVPMYNGETGTWKFAESDKAYDTLEAAQVFAVCTLEYPYYYKNKNLPVYANSFDDVLKVIMTVPDPEEISFTGLETHYGIREMNLLRMVKEKVAKIRQKKD